MKYELRRPCSNCPFRSDIEPYLTKARVCAIDRALVRGTFSCHKTNKFTDEGVVETGDSQHCAGALILLEKLHRPSQMMRIAERLGMYSHTALDMNAPVYSTFTEMQNAQQRGTKRRRRKDREAPSARSARRNTG